MHAPPCRFQLGPQSLEGTVTVIVDCTCGQWAAEQRENQRLADEWFRKNQRRATLSDWLN